MYLNLGLIHSFRVKYDRRILMFLTNGMHISVTLALAGVIYSGTGL